MERYWLYPSYCLVYIVLLSVDKMVRMQFGSHDSLLSYSVL